MKETCKGCCNLTAENDIGLAYCKRCDKIIFTDQRRCENYGKSEEVVTKWVSYDEKGYHNKWKADSSRSLSIYNNRPVLSLSVGGYIDPKYEEDSSADATALQMWFEENDNSFLDIDELKEAVIQLLPGVSELSGTNDLLKVTIEKIKG